MHASMISSSASVMVSSDCSGRRSRSVCVEGAEASTPLDEELDSGQAEYACSEYLLPCRELRGSLATRSSLYFSGENCVGHWLQTHVYGCNGEYCVGH